MKEITEVLLQNRLMLILVLMVISFDFITGIMKGIKTKTFTSKAMSNGVLKKLGEFIFILMCVAISVGLQVDYVATSGITFIFIMECYSNIENLSALGVPIASFVIKILASKVDEIEKGE